MAKRLYEFGDFRLDATDRLLLKEGQPVMLRPKMFDVLLALVESGGRIVEKEEMMRKVWPDSFVEEANLTQNISVLRKILNQYSDQFQYIETIPKRGYKFAAEVKELFYEEEDLIVESRSESYLIIEQAELDKGAGTEALPRAQPDPRPFAFRLSRGAASMLALGLVVVLAAAFLITQNKASAPSIAVLPFHPLSANIDNEAMGIEMADSLITRLSNLRSINVKPTSSIRKYMGTNPDALQAGGELGVRYVLEGSTQRVDDRVRVSVQLIDTKDGKPVWGGKFDKKFTDIFALQDFISEQVTYALNQKLSGDDEKLLTKRYTDNLDAYNSYMQGRYKYSKRELWESVAHFKSAINKDSNYSLAWAGLAHTYAMLGSSGFDVPPREILADAKHAAEKALEIDDTIPEAHIALGIIKLQYFWDWPGAEFEYKRAIELNPQDPSAQYWYVIYLIAMGRFDDAIAEGRRAEDADPVSIVASNNVGRALYYAGYYDEAIKQSKKTLGLSPKDFLAHFILGSSYREKGLYEEAIAEFQQAKEVVNGDIITLAAIATVHAKAGRREEALGLLEELKQKAEQRYISPLYIASVYASLGDRDEAFDWLEKAYEDRVSSLVNFRSEPVFNLLHEDPRFQALAKRIGLLD